MPTETQYTGNYIGKSLATIGLTQQLETGTTGAAGIYTQTILGVGDKYMIDLYGSLQTHRPEETPMLTIMESLGTESCNTPYFIWTDEYKGTSWWDISLDILRQRNTVDVNFPSTTIPGSGFGATLHAYGASLSGNFPMSPDAASSADPASTGYVGGQLKIGPVTAITSGYDFMTATESSSGKYLNKIKPITMESSNFMYGQAFVPTNGTTGQVWFAIPEEVSTVGSMVVVWNKLRTLLANLGYTEKVFTTDNTGVYSIGTALVYSSAAQLPVYMAFPNISMQTGTTSSTITQYNQVMARVAGVFYGTTGLANAAPTGLVFCIDFNDCNESLGSSLLAYAGGSNYDSVMIGQPFIGHGAPTAGTAVFGATASAAAQYAGSISRMLFIGQAQTAPLPIPEGDKFSQGGNMTQGREQLMNNTQIFVSPAYGVTGTHQASSFRFGDDFQLARDLNFSIYKKRMQAAFMYGIKFEGVANSSTPFVNGQPVRATSGLMDYAMFPIRHIKAPLATPSWGQAASSTFIVWLDKLGDNLAAYRQEGTKSLTFMVSQKFINKVNIYIRSLMGGNSTVLGSTYMGGIITLNKPSSISFGLEYYEYMTTSGVLMKFIHDPGLDNSPSIKVPFWIYGVGSLSPRDLMFAIDPKNMKRKVLRPDKIYGNIQDIGQDAFLEAIRGESGFMLRFPMNHAIVYAPES